MSYFKNIVLGIFIGGAVIGVMIFGGMINVGSSSSGPTDVRGTITLWGTFSTQAMNPFLADFKNNNAHIFVNYIEKDPATYTNDLIEAIASGTPPDLIILPDGMINHFKDKVTHIHFTSIPADTYNKTRVGRLAGNLPLKNRRPKLVSSASKRLKNINLRARGDTRCH